MAKGGALFAGPYLIYRGRVVVKDLCRFFPAVLIKNTLYTNAKHNSAKGSPWHYRKLTRGPNTQAPLVSLPRSRALEVATINKQEHRLTAYTSAQRSAGPFLLTLLGQ